MTEPTHPLPPWLAPVLAFVNTVDVEDHTDTLVSGPAALSAWLASQDLLPDPPPPVTATDYRLALTLRAGLRALALANNGGPVAEAAVAGLRQALGRLPLVVDPGWDQSASPPLRPHRSGQVTAALSQLAAGYATALATSLWHRLRRCPADDCAWVFWDSSAKGTRRWCTMQVCGNRAKARTFAQRQKPPSQTVH